MSAVCPRRDGRDMTHRSTGEHDLQAEPPHFITHREHLGEEDAEGRVGECLRELGDEKLDVEFPTHLRVSVSLFPLLQEIELDHTLKPKFTSASPMHPHTGITTTKA